MSRGDNGEGIMSGGIMSGGIMSHYRVGYLSEQCVSILPFLFCQSMLSNTCVTIFFLAMLEEIMEDWFCAHSAHLSFMNRVSVYEIPCESHPLYALVPSLNTYSKEERLYVFTNLPHFDSFICR